MPLLQPPPYKPKRPLQSGHIQTILPRLFRKVCLPPVVRRRIETPDGDFLDIDWHLAGSSRLAVIAHGLEGNSRRAYVLGMARALVLAGWDCITYNFRGCSREMNRRPGIYHSGDTRDLDTVLKHGLAHGIYDDAALIGFSMGGNQVLKYLGEHPEKVPAKVKKAIGISVPCDLAASAERLCHRSNFIYNQYFLRSLKNKIKLKHKQFPDLYPLEKLSSIRNIIDFDNAYTAPVSGFKDAADYYEKSSCNQFLPDIKIPALIINAKDDPFLTPECYPINEAENSPSLSLQIPNYGGHVGFSDLPIEKQLWSEDRVVRFLNT
ncbi:YheT family hydrolase [Maridesulfovibrio hydrothermalis]|uniref:Alpha/beta hydrolase fold protein n=1 Tax=Maridesulfovibrio hydrothermalis AM13 = DSM 14728 TaxID=1121451 RepID=L0RDW1_9BACT|nr:alpha/beta fold hydrolase [Maridesulfovibrio hydrothermalis]CCO24924.1 Alpha/beta hydrolase fold protein [Maridesulfovibrio hydrothermalis AM13 = DSM 14728]